MGMTPLADPHLGHSRRSVGCLAILQGLYCFSQPAWDTEMFYFVDVLNNSTPSGTLDSTTISHITSAEKEITGQDEPAKGGPTAMAQKHAGEPISSQNLHDITEGEKKITGGERIKGGPTATAQSELGKSRSS
ncbi:hypothetical protein F4678DRAFT_464562 [Xylaria arbuscula]|nr:hypothetical protein F4678DRAFT_464562 [Xylaria arbuscula]